MDGADGHLDRFAGTGELIGAFAINLDGREIRDTLRNVTEELREDALDISKSGCTVSYHSGMRSDFSLWVAGGGGGAKADGGDILFVELEEGVGVLSLVAGEDNEEAGSEGVEGAGVTNFDFLTFLASDAVFPFDRDEAGLIGESAADAGDYTKRTHPGWLIN